MVDYNNGILADASEMDNTKRETTEMKPYGDCVYCGGDVVEKLEEIDYRHRGELYILRNVPTGVCGQCGEQYFTADVARKMERSIEAGRDEVDRVSVPVIETTWV